MPNPNALVLQITAEIGSGLQSYYFSSHEIKSVGGQTFRPRLLGRPRYSTRMNTRFWSTGSALSGFSVGAFRLANADGQLDSWRLASPRNAVMLVWQGDNSKDFATFTQVGAHLLDRIEQPDRYSLDFVAIDALTGLDAVVNADTYSSAPNNPSIVGKPLPLLFGHGYSLPVVPTDPDPGNNTYDIHASGYAQLAEVTDKGDPFVAGVDYTETPTGFDLAAPPVGDVLAEAYGEPDKTGASTLGSELVTNGTFTAWTGDNPNGWGVTENGTTALVTQSPAGRCSFIHTSGFVFPAITQTLALTPGLDYQLSLDLTAIPAGATLTVSHNGVAMASYTSAGGTGTKTVTFTATGTSITLVAVIFGASLVTIDNVTVKRKRYTTAYTTLGGIIKAILDRAGISNYLAADLTALDAAIGTHELGQWVEDAAGVDTLLGPLLDSVGAWVAVDRLNRYRFGLLAAPGTPVATLTDAHILGSIEDKDDLAPGLTATLKARRNWQPLQAGQLVDNAQVTAAVRATLGADYRLTKQAASGPASYYSWAATACAAETLLTDSTGAQNAIDRWCGSLYSVRRYMRTVPVSMDQAAVLALEHGQTYRINSPLQRIINWDGVLVGWETSYLENTVELILWG